MADPLYCKACGGNVIRVGQMNSGNVNFSIFKCEKCKNKTMQAE